MLNALDNCPSPENQKTGIEKLNEYSISLFVFFFGFQENLCGLGRLGNQIELSKYPAGVIHYLIIVMLRLFWEFIYIYK